MMQLRKYGMTLLLWIAIAVIGRLIPHFNNATPMMSLGLLAGYAFSKYWGIAMTFISMILSDALIAMVYHYSFMGSWTLFTYSGFLLLVLFAPKIQKDSRYKNYALYLLFSTLGYWLWTNFGTWISTNIYAHNLVGLKQCFIAAIPFLRNAVIANIAYSIVFIAGLKAFWLPKVWNTKHV